ncbi:hypothetical protein K2173_024244 [Erythroxylum novogranatense]|uniref:Uncharacterized protein n=1 Tax=Erythroxylum novogranatense TaxID=1862640 RepID=A0AAV8UGD7_9ROSI|nr:hypothetical protein K2173_024244 [Erythroxylum novogranatense]
MMRYQRVSPDCIPLSNGKKPNAETTTSSTNSLGTETLRLRSPSRTLDHPSPETATSPIRGGSSDVLLQWGQKKRARFSRSEIRSSHIDESRRMEMMPPPRRQQQCNGGAGFHRNLTHRNVEKRSAGGSGSVSGASSRPPSRSKAAVKRSPEKIDGKMAPPPPPTSTNDKKQANNNNSNQVDSCEAKATTATATTTNSNNSSGGGAGQKVMEWPRISLSLSRKEKEDDFFAMRGTKLPHRPKKRPKLVDKSLQYCFPGMWLSDLTKSRYEVREKKSVKKQKRRGLKGMESMESDSD